MCVKVIASQRWDVFLRHGVYYEKVQFSCFFIKRCDMTEFKRFFGKAAVNRHCQETFQTEKTGSERSDAAGMS